MYWGCAITKKGFEYLLRTHGVAAEDSIIGFTEKDERIPTRGQQILAWVEPRSRLISDWVVLDDMAVPEVGQRLVQTDGKVGLTAADADRAIRILTWHRCPYCNQNTFPLAYHERGDCPDG